MTRSDRVLSYLGVAAALIPLVVVAAASVLAGIKIPMLTRDLAAIAGIHPLSGALSSMGVLLWWASAAVWSFSATLCYPTGPAVTFRFALSSGVLSAYLALDDLFQIHEALAPKYLLIPEEAVYGALAATIGAYLFLFQQEIRRRGYPLLALALFFLSVSVVVDSVLERWLWRLDHWTYFVEDGLKWLGIVSWTAFCFVWCRAELTDRHLSPPPSKYET